MLAQSISTNLTDWSWPVIVRFEHARIRAVQIWVLPLVLAILKKHYIKCAVSWLGPVVRVECSISCLALWKTNICTQISKLNEKNTCHVISSPRHSSHHQLSWKYFRIVAKDSAWLCEWQIRCKLPSQITWAWCHLSLGVLRQRWAQREPLS
jgi:hypothetical protein